MTEENDVDPQSASELKRRLLIRTGIAATLIVALLAGLAVLDSMNSPSPAKPAEVIAEAPTLPTTQPEAAPSKEEEKPIEQATAEEAKKPTEPAAEQETSAPPTVPSGPYKAERLENTGRAERPLTKPAEARLAMLKPSEPAAAVAAAKQRLEPSAELARQAPAPHAGAPASRPLTQQLAATAAHGGNFLLQLGVFSSTAHAEELRAKLELNGIPAQIEARVQVGPFSSREEAEQMRDKLRKLGLEGGVMVAVKK